ncbi:MAG: hypothetical protein GY906_12980 [bacterium]|nr:hypothetical protein [bacterium]
MAEFNRTRVQKVLTDAAKAGTFYPVSYDSDTQDPIVDDINPVFPTSVLVNEVGTTFDTPQLNRQTGRRERVTWAYQLRLKFNQEVLLEVFEDAMSENPIKLPSVPADGLRQMTLELEGSDPTHPVQQEPSTGTQVVYNFEASLSPA